MWNGHRVSVRLPMRQVPFRPGSGVSTLTYLRDATRAAYAGPSPWNRERLQLLRLPMHEVRGRYPRLPVGAPRSASGWVMTRTKAASKAVEPTPVESEPLTGAVKVGVQMARLELLSPLRDMSVEEEMALLEGVSYSVAVRTAAMRALRCLWAAVAEEQAQTQSADVPLDLPLFAEVTKAMTRPTWDAGTGVYRIAVASRLGRQSSDLAGTREETQ